MSTAEHTPGNCIFCNSARRVSISGKVCDSFQITMGSRQLTGYVPANIGLGDGGDYLDLELCLDCRRVQKTSEIRRIAKLDAPLPKGARQPARKPGTALPELQQMDANWAGVCACGEAYEEGAPIDYSLTIRAVVGCPCCDVKRAAVAA